LRLVSSRIPDAIPFGYENEDTGDQVSAELRSTNPVKHAHKKAVPDTPARLS